MSSLGHRSWRASLREKDSTHYKERRRAATVNHNQQSNLIAVLNSTLFAITAGNRRYHSVSQPEIGSDKRIFQHVNGWNPMPLEINAFVSVISTHRTLSNQHKP